MQVSKKIRNLYNSIFDGTATKVENFFVKRSRRKILKNLVKGTPKLTSKQKQAVRSYWKPYCRVKMDWFRYFTFANGKFDPRYIPEDIMQTRIDQHFNSRKLSYGFNDKNNYSLIFNKFKQPKTLVRKIDKLLFDETYHLIDVSKALEIISLEDEIVVKPTQDTGGGKNVRFLNVKDDANLIKNLLEGDEQNFMLQKILEQHPEMSKMHPNSLNTVRINTLLLNDGIHILNTTLRMGSGESRVDNFSSKRGILAHVDHDGKLYPDGLSYNDMRTGKRTKSNCEGLLLGEVCVPNFNKMLSLAKEIPLYTNHFRFVGLDFAVDENGDIVLIEVNMRKSDTYPIQVLQGPFFGELTEKVLDEVFGRSAK